MDQELRDCLQLIMDQVDYTSGKCSPNEMVAAVLKPEILDRANKALKKEVRHINVKLEKCGVCSRPLPDKVAYQNDWHFARYLVAYVCGCQSEYRLDHSSLHGEFFWDFYSRPFPGRDRPSGVRFVRLDSGEATIT